MFNRDSQMNSRPSTPASPFNEPTSARTSMAVKSPLGAKPIPSSSFNSSAFIASPLQPQRPQSNATGPTPSSGLTPNYNSLNLGAGSSSQGPTLETGSSTAGWTPSAPILPASSSSAGHTWARPLSSSAQQPMASSWSIPALPSSSSNGLLQPMRPQVTSTAPRSQPLGGWGDLDPLS